jgi:hypothetical protein
MTRIRYCGCDLSRAARGTPVIVDGSFAGHGWRARGTRRSCPATFPARGGGAFALAWAVVGLVSAFVATVVSWGATKSAETSNSLSDAFGDIYDFDLFGHTLDLRSLVAELVTALLVLAVVLVVLRRVPREE